MQAETSIPYGIAALHALVVQWNSKSRSHVWTIYSKGRSHVWTIYSKGRSHLLYYGTQEVDRQQTDNSLLNKYL
ncbi:MULTISPECIES: hypothetical protein [Microcoleaceae]|uniref:hypothetical protein n=1 Tax=Microcoleaceae TaxID=1892252 RepID=UPI001882180F|nr:hypothetical protein [Tychonema sp. LEGE 06208]MBE9162731.1 hypothetical protein [Tychonema sp. LEGE 06208]